MRDLGAVRKRDRHAEIGVTVREVLAPVDGIDDPLEARTVACAFDVARFLAQDRVLGECRADGRDDRVLRFVVGGGDDVRVLLRMRERVEALAGRFEVLRSGARGFGFVACVPLRRASTV